jgi:hypothetical protein
VVSSPGRDGRIAFRPNFLMFARFRFIFLDARRTKDLGALLDG